MNVLLCIIDCLRLDRVWPGYMPQLYAWGKQHIWYTNHWASSHCTDPSITHMLSGKHPDELRLYSMMYDRPSYSIPADVEMLPQFAKKHGYHTAFVTNLGRWYNRGVDTYINSRGWPGKRIFDEGTKLVKGMTEPWLIIVHTDDMHTWYTGGSYDAAARSVDTNVMRLISSCKEDTAIVVTSDHGEGLGETMPDGSQLIQHGHGLWPVLTHLPLLTNRFPWEAPCLDRALPLFPTVLVGNEAIHRLIKCIVSAEYSERPLGNYVFQAGAIPEVFHRGVVDVKGRQFIRATYKDGHHERTFLGDFTEHEKFQIERALSDHCAIHGIEYGRIEDEEAIIERLEGLGYWED